MLLTVALAVTGCQEGDAQSKDPAHQNNTGHSCSQVLSAEAKAAMLRLADTPASTKAEYLGEPRRTAEQLAAQYLTGKTDETGLSFCGAYTKSSGPASVEVEFSLSRRLPRERATATDFTRYRMGKTALVGTKTAFLYFDCASAKFDGTTQLVRGEVRTAHENAEPPAAARKDHLRVLHDSSRALSGLLGCETGSGITGPFVMPARI
ncbi:hypothetical protein AB0E62_17105 [Streptomyces sp. NPDC038707]|uniref:hypothetical protein n=1 Tax=unclassified Streptomyces TaxID=2593676 RepID=UPI0033F45C77